MKKLFIALTTLATLGLIGCADSGSKGGNGTPPPQVAPLCPQGQSYINGSCAFASPPVTVQGSLSYLADVGNTYDGGTNSISLTNKYKTFLKKAMAVCERAQYNGGSSKCSSWRDGYNSLVVTVENNLTNVARADFMSYPLTNSGINWDFQFNFLSPGTYAQASNPYSLRMNLAPYNANAGMALQANGQDGFNGVIINEARMSVIKIIIPNGQWGDNQLDFEVQMDSEVIMSGTLYKCSTLYCAQ